MSKQKSGLFLFVGVLLLAAAGAALAWWFWPSPLLDGAEAYRVYYARAYEGGTSADHDIDMTEFLDQEAALDVLGRYQRKRSVDRMSSYPVEEGMILLGVCYEEGPYRWHIVAAPGHAFAYTGHSSTKWDICDGGRLWQELSALLPLET